MRWRALPLNLAHDLIEQPAPMMPGITDPAGQPASQSSSATRRELGKAIPTSNLGCRRSNRTASQRDFPPNEITASTSGNKPPDGCDFFRREDRDVRIGPTTLDRPDGRNADDTIPEPVASTNENAERFQVLRRIPAGKKSPRLYRARSQLGRGVFQRLWTQNQSSGARRISSAIISFVFAVSEATLSFGGSAARRKIIRHFPGHR